MNSELYNHLIDDAQRHVREARDILANASVMLAQAGHPGMRLANRDAMAASEKCK